jgi:hypothetical protein
MLQLARAHMSEAQRIQWVGEDGQYKVRAWTGSDLGATRDVRILKGSFTQLSPSAKAGLAQAYATAGILSPEDLQHAISGNVGGLLGLQDDPYRQRVRRQISVWEQGPPEGWMPPMPQLDPMSGQVVVDPATGQPVISPDPVLGAIWARLPVDEQPNVATIRLYELGRAMAGTRYLRWPPPWRQGFDTEYLAMRQAAGVSTVAEQQAAQAAQAAQMQTQQQGQMALEQAKHPPMPVQPEAPLALPEDSQVTAMLAQAAERESARADQLTALVSQMGMSGGQPITVAPQISLPPRKLRVIRDEAGQIAELEATLQ